MTTSDLPATHQPRVPLSILDLAVVSEGATGAQALRDTLDTAIRADALGYRRIWFAEHHLSPGVASASPAVLAALVAERTPRIRVGSGAVLLSTTSPLIAAEQFGTVAALHPGRVDLGLGRAFTPPPARGAQSAGGEAPPSGTGEAPPAAQVPPAPARPAGPRVVDGLLVPAAPGVDFSDSALRERLLAQKEVVGASRTPGEFRAELELVLGLRAGTFTDGAGTAWTSPPVEGAAFDLFVLASSGGISARVAGELGLPLAANYHVGPSATLDTIAAYRAAFRPGVLDHPYVVVSADVLVADSDAEARRIGEPFTAWVLSIRRGAGGAIAYPAPGTSPAWEDLTDADRAAVQDRVDTRFVGSPETVVERLETLARVTGADEIVVTTAAHDPADRARSFELLAQHWGLRAAAVEPAVAAAREPALAR
ncbi:LLM class flavin-dependent oxidoreductase [Oerskovia jenensis]|uniref:Alkanesulfonate monooxygenase SsuD/methylene tetrahydromethanopterin reductase-like flavin-dependent oxidoreductase (Luciferase family) n=1 Tax=Oerskovia jenensis TaxID=162169 RepID=A0ABS2LEP0_9CELL|nr:LLM class flavin-dependent oxidoreductase [Oerskovia jenensis]MBM7478822.1 alkanesulfonate monooxygenase SsuD/methylene tetrahydromethanopterin reductase-like flavin-dependent oxidoreductase (luciferase family) [Oerskovia jenensis]